MSDDRSARSDSPLQHARCRFAKSRRPIALGRIVARIDHGQTGCKSSICATEQCPGNAAVIVPKYVCDGALAYVRLEQSLPNAVAQIVNAPVGQTDLSRRRRDARSALQCCSTSGSSLGAAVAGDELRDGIRVRAVPEAIQHVD